MNVEDGKTNKLKMAMVPIKVGVIITAKELMPDKEAAQHRFNVMVMSSSSASSSRCRDSVAVARLCCGSGQRQRERQRER